MTPKTILLFASSFLFLLVAVFVEPLYSQDGTTWTEYSSKGNPKTVGHDFTLKYPPSYEMPTDFSRDEYLQAFVFTDEEDTGDSYEYLTVGIHNLPKNIAPSSLRTEGLWNFKKLDEFWFTLAKDIEGIKTMDRAISWGNIPMVKFSTSEIKDDTLIRSAILIALHGDKLIKLECGNSLFGYDPDPNSDYDFAEEDLTTLSICSSYFNSLNFLDYPLP
jgi:hypothetical protein